MAHGLSLLELPPELLGLVARVLLCDDPRADAQAVGRLASSSKALQQLVRSNDAVVNGLKAARKMLTHQRQHEFKVAAGSLGSDAAFPYDPSDYKQLAQQLPPPETTLSLRAESTAWRVEPRRRLRVVARLLRVSGSLTALELARNKIGDDGAKALATAVAANGSLAVLHLELNNIGDEGAKALADGVAASSSLTTLSIWGNNIGIEGAKHLAEAVRASGSLATFDIGNNKIGVEGAKAIAAAVRASGSLAELYLYNNRIGDEGAKALVDAVTASGSLALKTLWVPVGLEKHAELVAACKAKGVKLM